MGILKSMIEESKNNIRFEKDGLIFYNPTKEQHEAFKDALKKIMTVQGVDPGIESVRFLIENSTNIGDEVKEYSDEQLAELMETNRSFKLLMRSIVEYIDECTEDIIYETMQLIKAVEKQLKLQDVDNMTEYMKKGLNGMLDRAIGNEPKVKPEVLVADHKKSTKKSSTKKSTTKK